MRIGKSTHRRLTKRGLRAIRFHGNDPDDYRVGGHIIVDVDTGMAFAGGYPEFCLSADDVAEIAADVPGFARAPWA